MRLVRSTLTAAASNIIPLDPHKIMYDVTATMYGDNSINATAQVDATISSLTPVPVSVSRSGSTVTVTFESNHYLGATTDYVVISGSGVSSIDGCWPVASITSTTVITFTSSASGTVASTACLGVAIKRILAYIASAAVSKTTPATVAVSSTSLDLTQIPLTALILTCTAYTAGTVVLDVLQVGEK